ncbi:MAG: transposase [Saprospiraceae bacterium]
MTYHQKADYPKNVAVPVQYGSSVISLILYLNVFQYIPYNRLKDFFSNVLNHSISKGTISNVLIKAATKSRFVYDEILEEINKNIYVGGDGTGIKVNGKKSWIWVWQNVKNTYLAASNKRGFPNNRSLFPKELPIQQ